MYFYFLFIHCYFYHLNNKISAKNFEDINEVFFIIRELVVLHANSLRGKNNIIKICVNISFSFKSKYLTSTWF